MQHFASERHMNNDSKVVVLETSQPKTHINVHRILPQRESYWIFRLGTLVPHGLNIELDLSAFL